MAKEIVSQFTFSYKELAEILVRHQGLCEGIWGLSVEFGLSATNYGAGPEDVVPTAILPVLSIGLQRFAEVNNLSVDAAGVNPLPPVPDGGGEAKPPRRATKKAAA